MSATYKVTHFYRMISEPKGWVHATYVTCKRGTEEYFWNQDHVPFPKRRMEEDLREGSLVPLSPPHDIGPHQAIWISPDQSVYLADAHNPLHPKPIKLFQDDRIASIYDIIEQAVIIKINSTGLNTQDPMIATYFAAAHWKILVSVIVKLLQNETIDEKKFDTIGYVFPRLETLYGLAFTTVLNEYDLAINLDQLCFRDRKLDYRRWNIAIDAAATGQYLSDYLNVTKVPLHKAINAK